MIVVKAGGSKGIDFQAVCADVVDLVREGEQVVLVHGSSHDTNVISAKLGHPPRFVTSLSGHTSRYTDRETLEILAMVTAGRINTLLVERLQALGVNAIGLSGLDGRLLEAKRKESLQILDNGKRKVLHGEYSGQIQQVNAPLLQSLLAGGYLPVIAPLAISPQGEALNVDGDRAAIFWQFRGTLAGPSATWATSTITSRSNMSTPMACGSRACAARSTTPTGACTSTSSARRASPAA